MLADVQAEDDSLGAPGTHLHLVATLNIRNFTSERLMFAGSDGDAAGEEGRVESGAFHLFIFLLLIRCTITWTISIGRVQHLITANGADLEDGTAGPVLKCRLTWSAPGNRRALRPLCPNSSTVSSAKKL